MTTELEIFLFRLDHLDRENRCLKLREGRVDRPKDSDFKKLLAACGRKSQH